MPPRAVSNATTNSGIVALCACVLAAVLQELCWGWGRFATGLILLRLWPTCLRASKFLFFIGVVYSWLYGVYRGVRLVWWAITYEPPNSTRYRQTCPAAAPPPKFLTYMQPSSEEYIFHLYPQLQDLSASGVLLVKEVPVPPGLHQGPGKLDVLLVGTAHLSTKSAEDVERVILAAKPHFVLVELCQKREFLMYLDQLPQPSEEDRNMGMFQALQMLVSSWRSQSGLPASRTQNPMALLMSLMLSKLGNNLGTHAGGEFVAARKAAQRLEDEGLVDWPVPLIAADRAVDETVWRSWLALTKWQRLKVCAMLLYALLFVKLDTDAVESFKNEDVISQQLELLSKAFPALLKPLLHERNWHLARAVYGCAAPGTSRRVVVVVGKGHLEGLGYCLDQLLTHGEAHDPMCEDDVFDHLYDHWTSGSERDD